MILKKMRSAVLLGLAIVLAGCSSSHTVKEPSLSGLALQQLQSREFDAPLKPVFASVLSVLQDAGYIIESADTETGFITANSPIDSGLSYSLFGLGKKSKSTRVTAFIEPMGVDMTRVRLNFLAVAEDKTMYGMSSRKDTPIEDAQIYANAFEKIEETVFIRLSTN